MTTTIHKGTALITGASTGIGAVYADRLARRGYDLILVARNIQRLQELAARLTTETGRSVETISADLTQSADVSRVEQTLQTDASITMLVNNAGVGASAPLLSSEISKMEDLIALNINAVTRLTYAAAPRFAARGVGTIINVSSIAALTPEILNGVYGGSKAFVLALSQSLHHELSDKGIVIQAVLPGATATEFWNPATVPLHHLPKEIVMTAEDMVDAALSGLDQGELVTIPALPDAAHWEAYETARQTMRPVLSLAVPAERYRGKSGSA